MSDSAVRKSRDDADDRDDRNEERPRANPVTFYKQVVAELRKVVYPTQAQLVTYFIVVMVFVLVMITLVTLLDLGLGKAVFELFTAGTNAG